MARLPRTLLEIERAVCTGRDSRQPVRGETGIRAQGDGRDRGQPGQRVEAVRQELEDGARHERSALHVTRRYATANP